MDSRFLTDSEMVDMMRQAGVRPSAQRLAVLRYVGNSHAHPTSDEIYREMLAGFPSLSRTTVYNSLHALVDVGLVRELEIDAGNKRFDLAPQPPHSHFICRHCGCIYDMPLAAGFAASAPRGFAIDSVDVYGKGLCPGCVAAGNTDNKQHSKHND